MFWEVMEFMNTAGYTMLILGKYEPHITAFLLSQEMPFTVLVYNIHFTHLSTVI